MLLPEEEPALSLLLVAEFELRPLAAESVSWLLAVEFAL